MTLTFKRREIKDLHHLGTLVAENAEAIEPGLRIVGSNLNLGRASVELVAIDSAQTPVLITLGLTADDAMLLRALEGYAWCLEYPESVQKLVPATTQPEWPPRVVFVAERLLAHCDRRGIGVVAFYILGLPTDTEESIAATIEYATELNTVGAQFTIATPYPGTGFFDSASAEGRLLTEDWDRYDIYTPVLRHDRLSSDDMLRLKSRAYHQYYFRPAWAGKFMRHQWRRLTSRRSLTETGVVALDSSLSTGTDDAR